MLSAYINALALIFIAEMGDKTQILAMSFATRFKVRHVLTGIAIGAFLNHGLAIALGSLITRFASFDLINLVAGVIFLAFGLMSLKAEEDEEEDGESSRKLGPVLTVAAAFFVGELGDKTQLTALTLAAGSPYPQIILAGTVSGMVLTSMIGILVGMKLGKKIPEMQLKLGACAIFLFFGVQKILASSYMGNIPLMVKLLALVVLGALTMVLGRQFVKASRELESTRFKRKAEALYQYTHKISDAVDQMCLGLEHCEVCSGDKCLIGNLKGILKQAREQDRKIDPLTVQSVLVLTNKNFSKATAAQIVELLGEYYAHYPEEYLENGTLTNVRMTIERILFDEVLEIQKNYETYERMIEAKHAAMKQDK